MAEPTGKVCVLCGVDCAGLPRVKDRKGRYYCQTCHDEANARKKARQEAQGNVYVHTQVEPPDPQPTLSASPTSEEDLGVLSQIVYDIDEQKLPVQPVAVKNTETKACPGCDQPLPVSTKICVNCGINVDTGRSIVTSRRLDVNLVYINADQILRWVSWLIPFGYSPLASEALGMRRPYTTWAVALLTIVVSCWFWLSTSSQMNTRKDLMLWSGSAPLTAEQIEMNYQWTDWGDENAFETAFMRASVSAEANDPDRFVDVDRIIVEAHSTLTPSQQCVGQFHWYQLVTHALLHADIIHLVGNLIFLLILGARVNCLIGNIAMIVVYPLLAIAAAWIQMIASTDTPPTAMLGASGAIMGMAGLYFILFPTNRVYMGAWFRWWFFFRIKIWTMSGFWVLLMYITFDVMYIILGAETGTAHWAHVGGFIVGSAIALGLLLGRVLDAGGGDLLSVVLRRHAWKLIGRPGDSDRVGLRLPGV